MVRSAGPGPSLGSATHGHAPKVTFQTSVPLVVRWGQQLPHCLRTGLDDTIQVISFIKHGAGKWEEHRKCELLL